VSWFGTRLRVNPTAGKPGGRRLARIRACPHSGLPAFGLARIRACPHSGSNPLAPTILFKRLVSQHRVCLSPCPHECPHGSAALARPKLPCQGRYWCPGGEGRRVHSSPLNSPTIGLREQSAMAANTLWSVPQIECMITPQRGAEQP
jgi:hypothetical protein